MYRRASGYPDGDKATFLPPMLDRFDISVLVYFYYVFKLDISSFKFVVSYKECVGDSIISYRDFEFELLEVLN